MGPPPVPHQAYVLRTTLDSTRSPPPIPVVYDKVNVAYAIYIGGPSARSSSTDSTRSPPPIPVVYDKVSVAYAIYIVGLPPPIPIVYDKVNDLHTA